MTEKPHTTTTNTDETTTDKGEVRILPVVVSSSQVRNSMRSKPRKHWLKLPLKVSALKTEAVS
jgi:hypothetical protein